MPWPMVLLKVSFYHVGQKLGKLLEELGSDSVVENNNNATQSI